PPISKRRAEICPRNAKQGRQVEKNRLGNEDGANGLIVQRLLKFLGSTVGIIFLIGLVVVIALFKLVF
ncbi:hypothetical protein, partial [Pseudomonas syringae]|uniref:hypothetical protein n=1 Tax=Pseudomonas syringae TaxID=317 RepID=UPI000AF6CE52